MRVVASRSTKAMAQPSISDQQRDISGLAAACRKNKSYDASGLTPATWKALSEVLVAEDSEDRACVIRQGESDRSLYFLESGLLRVYRTDNGARLQLGVIGPGSVVGEGGFFSPSVARSASVEAIQASLVWKLSPERFATMASHHPGEALALALYVGAVMNGRMRSVAGRWSVT